MVSAMIRTPLHAPSLAATVVVLLLGLASVAEAAEGGATPPPAAVPAASCVEQDKKVAEQAAEIARLNKRIEELEDELDLMDMQ